MVVVTVSQTDTLLATLSSAASSCAASWSYAFLDEAESKIPLASLFVLARSNAVVGTSKLPHC